MRDDDDDDDELSPSPCCDGGEKKKSLPWVGIILHFVIKIFHDNYAGHICTYKDRCI